MNAARDIDQDSRIAEYVLGLCPAQESGPIQEQLGRSDPSAACALKWEAYLLGICDSLVPIAPPPGLFARIQDALGHHAPAAAPAPAPKPAVDPAPALKRAVSPAPAPKAAIDPAPAAARSAAAYVSVEQRAANSPLPHPARSGRAESAHRPGPWRLIAVLLGAAVVTLGFFLAKAWSRPDIPAIQIVQVAPTLAAILQAPRLSSTPGWLVTVDTQGTVRLDPHVRTSIQPDEAVQLWTRTADGQESRSLGLVDPNQTVTVPAGIIGIVVPGQIFEMTLERKEGSASGKPEGPILFIGQMVTFGVQSPSKPLA